MKENEKAGLKEAAKFALQPNMWGFCGEDESQEILRDFVAERKIDYDLVRDTLHYHGFPHLNAFLETLAAASTRDIFDEELVMAYWMGNNLIENVGQSMKPKLVEEYKGKFSDEFARRLEIVLPENIYLTHLSQVALIAAADYEQPEKINLINHCMIAYGEVTSLDMSQKMATVQRDVLQTNNENGYAVVTKTQRVKIDTDLTPQLCVGDKITVHLGYLATIVTSDEAENLRYWTRKVAKSL